MFFIAGVGDEGFEIGGAEVVADGLDAAGLVEVFADIERFHVAGGADECGEVAPCGTAPDAEAGGIDVVGGGVGAEPADGGFAVFDLGGEDGVAAEAVVDAGDGVSALDPILAEGLAVFLAAALPSAAVDPDDEWCRVFGFFRQVEVEGVAFVAAFGVGEIAMGGGSGGGEGGGEEQGYEAERVHGRVVLGGGTRKTGSRFSEIRERGWAAGNFDWQVEVMGQAGSACRGVGFTIFPSCPSCSSCFAARPGFRIMNLPICCR